MTDIDETCRLCQAQTDAQFNCLVLGKYNVKYFRCRGCESLQTEQPYWLEQAYRSPLASSDVGAAQRCLISRVAVWWTLAMFGLRRARILDFGGGTGLLCRLLRDVGFDAWTCDAYGSGEFAQAYRVDSDSVTTGAYDVVTAFEVAEHLPNPRVDLGRLFAGKPKLVLLSTSLYGPEFGSDWWYISPQEGQHVFFYSRKALEDWASSHGYWLLSIAGWQIFVDQKPTPLQRAMLAVLLNYRALRLSRVAAEMWPTTSHVMSDHGAVLRRIQHGGSPKPSP